MKKEDPEDISAVHAKRQVTKDIFISVLALISVGIGLYDLQRERLTSHFTWYDVLDLLIVLVFIVDFVWSAVGSGNWRDYIKRHWYELPSLIPVTGNMVFGAQAVPLLRSLRLVRLIRVFRLLRVAGTAVRLRKFFTTSIRIARRAHLDLLSLFGLIVILTGAGVSWLVESSSNTEFSNIGDALWWAINMFTNVAYVEFHPITFGGRIVATILEFAGMAFIGLFTASLAGALLTDKPVEHEEKIPPLE